MNFSIFILGVWILDKGRNKKDIKMQKQNNYCSFIISLIM